MSEVSELEFPSWIVRKRDANRGPWLSSIKLALSDDGLNFEKTHRVLVDRGGVSNICLDSEGRIIVSYQYFSFLQEERFDKIAVSISSDNGETWEGPTIVRFNVNGIKKLTSYNPMDPAMVLLDNGQLRLYSTSGRVPGPEYSGIVGCVSAISSNGIDFKVEEGYRFTIPNTHVLDPTVIKIGNEWHYYSPIQNKRGRNYHAVSEDGLTFKMVEDIVLEMRMLGTALPVEGGYRFYGTGPKGMSAFSKDGYDWTQEDVRMPGPDPGVVKLKGGKYLMSYTTKRKP